MNHTSKDIWKGTFVILAVSEMPMQAFSGSFPANQGVIATPLLDQIYRKWRGGWAGRHLDGWMCYKAEEY